MEVSLGSFHLQGGDRGGENLGITRLGTMPFYIGKELAKVSLFITQCNGIHAKLCDPMAVFFIVVAPVLR